MRKFKHKSQRCIFSEVMLCLRLLTDLKLRFLRRYRLLIENQIALFDLLLFIIKLKLLYLRLVDYFI